MKSRIKKIFKKPHLSFAIGALVLLSIFAYTKSGFLGGLATLISLYAFFTFYQAVGYEEEIKTQRMENVEQAFSDSTRAAVFGMPFPISLIRQNGEIFWYNTLFKNLFPERQLTDEDIEVLIPKINLKDILTGNEEPVIQTDIWDQHYEFHYNVVDTYEQEERNLILLYGINKTEDEKIKKAYQEEALVVMVMYIDNYDELSASMTDNRPLAYAEIDKSISQFAIDYGGFARKYQNDRYILVFRKGQLDKMIEDRFPIVQDIKEIEHLSSIDPTLSVGVGANADNPLEVYKVARLAVDIALGRGGDQIVVNDGKNLTYYGGKKKAVDMHNKVKARVMSHAITQLIDQSDQVFVMGHNNPDMDAFGACLGIYTLVRYRGKNCHIVLKEITPPIQSLYTELVEKNPEIQPYIIKPREAEAMVNMQSLVIVVDTHRKTSVEAPEILDLTDKVVIVDHHRRGADYIEEPTLTYLEPYASSASELVTELIQYTDGEVEVPPVVADGLLAGITLDTKHFSFQTGVRTFEAASVLKRYGADSINVKKLFREPANIVKQKSKVVAEAYVYKEVIAISKLENEFKSCVLIASQAADELLDMKGVKASFVLCQVEDQIHISGRSMGDISVQILLEKLGGGGHQSSAGVQLEGMDMDSAESVLLEAIDNYLMEEENESNITN